MKTYKNLWEQFVSPENLDLAARKAVRSRKNKNAAREFLAHREFYLKQLRDTLIQGNFQTSKYIIFDIFEPKHRQIYMLPLYPDHIVHHALINVLGPIWHKMFIPDSYACIPGRGLHSASNRIMHFVRRNKYVLQCDIRKFFPSINHDIMMQIIQHKIHDRRLLDVLHNIIYSVGGQENLPIGNLTSQWMGNLYLNEMDYFIKHTLHCRDYIRYCDDFCLFGNDVGELDECRKQIELFLECRLALSFSRANINCVSHGVCFIGYRHFPDFVLLRKSGMRRIRRRIMNIIQHDDSSELAYAQMCSAHGWLKWACTYNLRRSIGVCAPHVFKW